MKYKKTFYAVCGLVFLITLWFATILALDVFGVIALSVFKLTLVVIGLLVLLMMSFCCCCILQSFYEDWKWRHVKRNDKWQR